jgi:hypothetical protein
MYSRVKSMRPNPLSVILSARLFGKFVVLSTALPLCIVGKPAYAEDDSAHLQAHKKTAPYYQDAQLCRSRSKVDPLPDGADPAITIDPSKYLSCINQMGYHQEAKTDPFLVAIHRCESQKTKSVSASGEVIHRSPSQAQVRACLATRGFPSAGTPPNPNAPVAANQKQSTSDTQPPRAAPSTPSTKPYGVHSDEGQVETVVIPPRNR